jgi:hypothetical protein
MASESLAVTDAARLRVRFDGLEFMWKQPASKLGIESMVMVVESLLEGNLANAIWMQHLWTMLSCSAHVTGPEGHPDGMCLECNTTPPPWPATMGWQIRGALPCSLCASGGTTLAFYYTYIDRYAIRGPGPIRMALEFSQVFEI